MSYCKIGEKATITYYKESNYRETLVITNTPVDVQFERIAGNCWRFFGTGDDKFVSGGSRPDQRYEVFVNGNKPSYINNPSDARPGVRPVMDGNAVFPVGYYYISDYGFQRVNSDTPTPGVLTGGSCRITGNEVNCVITISDSKGNTYKDNALCEKSFTVSCGDECPEGYCKCASTNYPGYCCLPCSEVKSGLLAIARNIL